MENPDECTHPQLPEPDFDEDAAAAGLGSDEVRKRWPRVEAACPDCGAHVILYASFAHYLYGDW